MYNKMTYKRKAGQDMERSNVKLVLQKPKQDKTR